MTRVWMILGTVLLAGGAAAAQDDPVDREVQRLKERLQLTDEQTATVKDALKAAQEKIRGALNDDQKRRYDEQNQRGGGRGGRQFGGGGMGGMMPSAESLKEPLGLTDDQVKKIDGIFRDIRTKMGEYFQNGGSRDGFQEFMNKTREEGIKQVKDLLTDEQKTKFDKMMADQQQQGGERRGPSIEERAKRAMDALKVENADEATAIQAAVKKVLEAQEKLESAQRETRGKVDELVRNTELSEEAIGDRISEIREKLAGLEKELKAAQKELREIITNRQELELIRRGVLR